MSELISGKEALIALANGEEVEQNISGEWIDIRRDISWRAILGVKYQFRLKPSIITINGIEVPRNSKRHDKDDVVWVINTSCENWYDWIYRSDCDSNTLYWKTEEEIKQVVAALRSVFEVTP